MKKWLLPLLAGGVLACSSSKEAEKMPADALSFASVIDSAYVLKHLTVVAHDSLEGRDTGSKGQEKAADYLISQYKKLGLRGGMPDGSFLQPIELNSTKLNGSTYTVFKKTDKDTTEVLTSVLSPESTPDFIQLYGGNVSFTADVVFAGFGVTDEKKGINPFEGVDVKDKWVMAFLDIPTVVGEDTVYSQGITNNVRFREVVMAHGAKGVLLIPSTDGRFDRNAATSKDNLGKTGGLRLAYLDEGNDLGFSYGLVRPNTAAMMLGLADTIALKAEYDVIAKSAKTFKATSTPYQLSIKTDVTPVKVMSYNIVAILDGSDPVKKDELVVMSSHYDHVGIGNPDDKGDKIYNGADDDGSGTVGLLGVATALTKAKAAGVGPKRSVMILHVTGEEKGLLGSRYYSDHPTWPIESTIANVNADMIGRIDTDYQKTNDGDYIYIIGASIISSTMDSLLQVANNKTVKIKLDMKYNDLNDPNQFYRRSDHWNFGRLGVPFSFFFNGVHEDYHRPSDSIEKIAFNAMAKRAQLLYAYAIELANMNGRPVVDNQEFINKTKANPR
ncbi:M28 family peptidase [bacterium]|nr:MAG: M28 family peptidase [bacterium]